MHDLSSALASDAEVWLPVTGATLAPILRPGDHVCVRRCDAGALRRGDLVLERCDDVWMGTMVVSTRPLRTSALRGDRTAATPCEIHGRMVERERDGQRRPLGARDRARAWALHRALALSRALLLPRARAAVWRLGAVRRRRAARIGPLVIRRPLPHDAEALDAFSKRTYGSAAAGEFLQRQLGDRWRRAGFPVAAFDAVGTMRGFVFVDEYRAEDVELDGQWVRMLAVDPSARALGIGAALVRAAVDAARAAGHDVVRADIEPQNDASLRLFRAVGFTIASREHHERANRALRARRGKRWLVVVEWRGEGGASLP